MSYLEHVSEELSFIQKELQKPHSYKDWEWLDRQESSLMSESSHQMIEKGLLLQRVTEWSLLILLLEQ